MTTAHTFRPAQSAYLLALAARDVCKAAFSAARTSVVMPDDYDTNDAAADAYEMALMDLEQSTGYTAACDALRTAERAMVAAETARISAMFPDADLSSLDRAERTPRVWERLVDVCARAA